MSAAPERVKQPGEKRTLSFDFTSKLKATDAVASVVSVAEVGTTALTITAPSLVGNVVSVQVSGGTAGQRYNVECSIDTVLGDRLYLDVFIRISDTDN